MPTTVVILKYPEVICKLSKSWDYQAEIDYIVQNTQRNTFIKNLALSLKGNSLILFQLVQKQGKELYKIIDSEKNNRKVFFVYGATDVETRESIRAITEKETDAIIVASYGTFATGINNGYKRVTTPFRAVNNSGDFLGRVNYSCGGSNQVNSKVAANWTNLAIAYTAKGETDKAALAVAEVKKLNPNANLATLSFVQKPMSASPQSYKDWFEKKYLPLYRKAGLPE